MSKHENPPEPTGYGAVVETTSGEILVRYYRGDLAPWITALGGTRPYRYYKDQRIARVLSEGVTL